MHDRLRHTARAWLAQDIGAVLVEVTDTKGSVPRGQGTRMLVSGSAAVGTVGGGHLEWQCIAVARQMIAAAVDAPRTLQFALGPSLGQCCGGAVTLQLAPLRASHEAEWPDEAPLFHLQLHGAGHVGRAIARLLATLPVQVDWLDERDDEFPESLSDGAWPAHIRKHATDGVEGEVAAAPAGAHYLVLTHRHDLDQRIAEAILRRGDFGFFGLIGSVTKRQKFIHRFEAMGLPPERVARMVCPIGLPGITGKSPEVIAISAVAQLLQRAGSGD